MACSLDEDEICNDDYYSLLNVRREVQAVVLIEIDKRDVICVDFSVFVLGLILAAACIIRCNF